MRAIDAIGRLDLLHADRLLPLGLGQKHLRGAGLVDHVDRLVGQLAVMDVARRQLDRRLHRVAGVAQLVELLEIGLEALQDLDRVGDARLLHVDLLEPPHERAVLLEILPVFLVGGGADAAQRPLRERRLQQVRASIAPPEVAPAPITVWISSMKRIASLCCSISFITCLRRSSKSPR